MTSEHMQNIPSYETLRRRAEEILQKTDRNKKIDPTDQDLLDILNELELHQVELDLQNEELRRTAKELEAVRDEYYDLYNSAPVGFVITDRKGRITEVNKAAVTLLRSADRLRGMPFIEFIDPQYIAGYFTLLKKASAVTGRETGKSMELCLKGQKPDRRICLNLEKKLDESGRIQEWRFALTDISRAKKAEKELRAYDGLEEKVQARTAESQIKTEESETLNQQLVQEINRRKKLETELNAFGEKLTKAYQQRDYLSRRLVDLLERERRNMGNVLHDQIGQILTGISIQLEELKGVQTRDGAMLKDRIDPIQDRVKETIRQTRGLSHHLRIEILERFGLINAIRNLTDEVKRQSRIQVQLSTKGIPEDRIKEGGIDVTLYRVVQEGLNNVLKHAGAETAFIHLAERDGKIALTLEDDGVGFDYDAVIANKDPLHGPLGLTIMKERVALVGGEFQIESAPGKGTCMLAEIPLTPPCTRK